MRRLTKLVTVFLLFFILAQCSPPAGHTDNSDGNGPDNRGPQLNAISPKSKVSHLPSFTLTATGAHFAANSSIVFNGTPKQTTYVSSAELTCQIDPADIVESSSTVANGLSRVQNTNVPVLVRNPSPGGGDSNSIDFMIYSNHAFTGPDNISANHETSLLPSMAVGSTGSINVVWSDSTPGNHDIYFCQSSDSGMSWSRGVNISATAKDSMNPAIAVDGAGNIDVVWEDSTPGNYDIYFCQSTDNGLNWSRPLNITNNSKDSANPAIAADGAGNINVVWEDNTSGKHVIYFSQSTDGGLNWSQALNVSDSSRSSLNPAVAVDGAGNINVVWEDSAPGKYNIFYSRSTDSGVSWSSGVNISASSKASWSPAVGVDSAGNINVAWTFYHSIPVNTEIYFSRSIDNGVSWSQAVNISASSNRSINPSMAVDRAGNINVVWRDYTPGNYDIFFSRSIDDGVSWSEAVNISDNPEGSLNPSIAVDQAGNIYIVWDDYAPGNYDIFFTSSTGD
jgi:hypothetical protein